MQVRIYDTDKQGNETFRSQCDLAECFPDDVEDRERARRELDRSGLVWVGGGAAPLVLLKQVGLHEAIEQAHDADDHFERVVKLAGFKSRWDWQCRDFPETVRDAYHAKVKADRLMHEAFVESRGE